MIHSTTISYQTLVPPPIKSRNKFNHSVEENKWFLSVQNAISSSTEQQMRTENYMLKPHGWNGPEMIPWRVIQKGGKRLVFQNPGDMGLCCFFSSKLYASEIGWDTKAGFTSCCHGDKSPFPSYYPSFFWLVFRSEAGSPPSWAFNPKLRSKVLSFRSCRANWFWSSA